MKSYYLKESAYYDQANSTFHIKPLALCPVMMREDDFGGEATKYPLFWVKYSDLEPFLSRQTIMTSERQQRRRHVDGRLLHAEQVSGQRSTRPTTCWARRWHRLPVATTAKYTKEQQRIEAELEAFKNNIFGDKLKRDSLDSIADAHPANVKAAAKKERKAKTKTEKASRRTKSSSSSVSSSAARVSVRRQRH